MAVTSLDVFEAQVFRDLREYLAGAADVYFTDELLSLTDQRNDGLPRVGMHVQPTPADAEDNRGQPGVPIQVLLQVEVYARPVARRRGSDIEAYLTDNSYLCAKNAVDAILGWAIGRRFVEGAFGLDFIDSTATSYPIQSGESEYAMSLVFGTTLFIEPNRTPKVPAVDPDPLRLIGPPLNEVTAWIGEDEEDATPTEREAEEVELYP